MKRTCGENTIFNKISLYQFVKCSNSDDLKLEEFIAELIEESKELETENREYLYKTSEDFQKIIDELKKERGITSVLSDILSETRP